MDQILTTLCTPQMVAALETNMEEEMMCFGRGLSGGEMYNDGEIEGFLTRRAHLNGILRTHLKRQEAAYVEDRIQMVKRYFREKGITKMAWSLGQDCQPTNMATHLKSQGFLKLHDENMGMALDIASMQTAENKVKDLEIREVADLEGLKAVRQIEIEGFGSSAEMAQNYFEMYATVGFGKGTAWRHFSGWQRGKAVASASLLFHAGVAGIYGVATIPEARRQGIARAMVLRAIQEARLEGYRIVVLSPTEMSEGIYRRLGFREYTRIRHYTCTL
ncbi:MAG TPA: GNAT family N-acetyltransferase [Ktedonobacteraceae bacterium]|nr:GNAT family N-acetyltransferase [Ktedonobacteraceae bacterium]